MYVVRRLNRCHRPAPTIEEAQRDSRSSAHNRDILGDRSVFYQIFRSGHSCQNGGFARNLDRLGRQFWLRADSNCRQAQGVELAAKGETLGRLPTYKAHLPARFAALPPVGEKILSETTRARAD